MNEGIHLDLDTWIVPGQIRKANLCLLLMIVYYQVGHRTVTNYVCLIQYMYNFRQ